MVPLFYTLVAQPDCPKGSDQSRAQIARAHIQMIDLPAKPQDIFVAWAPLFHMVSTDTVFKTLMIGGTVHVTDGFDALELASIIADEPLGRLTLMPGMISPLIEAVRKNGSRVKGIKWIGVMADLVPLDQIAEVTTLLNAPYLNTFGATETGWRLPLLERSLWARLQKTSTKLKVHFVRSDW